MMNNPDIGNHVFRNQEGRDQGTLKEQEVLPWSTECGVKRR